MPNMSMASMHSGYTWPLRAVFIINSLVFLCGQILPTFGAVSHVSFLGSTIEVYKWLNANSVIVDFFIAPTRIEQSSLL